MPNYQLGKIYTIICNITKEPYIGSTCEPTLARRLASHNGDYTDWLNGDPHYISSFQILKRGNYQIVLLENCPCNNKDELRMKEREWFDKIQNINKLKPFRSIEEKKEYHNKYYQNNKEELKAKVREYRETNLEKVKETQKLYYEANKEELCKKRNEKITCECGGKYTVSNKSGHIKTIKHQTFIKNNIDIL